MKRGTTTRSLFASLLACIWLSVLAPDAAGEDFKGDWPEFVEDVRRQALSYTDRLPDFICKQTSERWVLFSGLRRRFLDEVVAEISFYGKTEHSRLLSVAGKPVAGEAPLVVPGLSSRGEFGDSLRLLFHPATGASFTFDGTTKIGGRRAVRIKYQVPRETSRLTLSAGDESFITGYRGHCWVDPETRQVLRLDNFATDLPADSLVTYSASRVEYGPVSIADNQHWLPVKAYIEFRANKSNGKRSFDFYSSIFGFRPIRVDPATVQAVNSMTFGDYQKFEAKVRFVRPDEQ
jgi:hypothetical protein